MNVIVNGPIAPSDIALLCRSACAFLEGGDADLIVCDVGALVDADAGTVDALARLQLVAKRLGHQVRLLHARHELVELLALMGLRDAVPLCEELGIEPGRQAEEREHPRGVEKEADTGDPAP